jgi:DNA-binding NtrC family response regulator
MKGDPKILLIDDQWGREDNPMIPTHYGHLPFDIVRESAEESPEVFSTKRALKRVRQEQPAVVLLDVRFGRKQPRLGVEILEVVRAEFPALPVVMFTSLESEKDRELLVKCMKYGANEYVEKAPNADQMKNVLEVYTSGNPDKAICGNSPAIRELRAAISRASFGARTSILISGRTGAGKELVAGALHRQGIRRNGPFKEYNCANQDSELLESELFGHKKGAFTGATADRVGLLEEVDGGVLFLDEVASMPLRLQGKLLRVLETHKFRRLGANEDISSDFQLICAINQPVEELLKSKQLREDFYYRIEAFTLHVPLLKDRREDIPILANIFLQRFKMDRDFAGHQGERFSEESLRRMQSYDWPGNVRELKNAVERTWIASIDKRDKLIQIEMPLASASPADKQDAHENAGALSDDPAQWERERLLFEIRLAIKAKRYVETYKGGQWRAEFMRILYPEKETQSAKGLTDLIKRLTKGPWGSPKLQKDAEIKALLDELNAR